MVTYNLYFHLSSKTYLQLMFSLSSIKFCLFLQEFFIQIELLLCPSRGPPFMQGGDHLEAAGECRHRHGEVGALV